MEFVVCPECGGEWRRAKRVAVIVGFWCESGHEWSERIQDIRPKVQAQQAARHG